MNPLIVLNEFGSRPPLFSVHPIGGYINEYLRLQSLLPAEQPHYGILSRARLTPETEHSTIEAMAADYADVIQRVRPDGPYRLFGWSLGALTAHAIACVLSRRGAIVDVVAMVDPPIGVTSVRDDLAMAITMAIQLFHPSPPSSRHLRRALLGSPGRHAVDGSSRWCVSQGLLPAGVVPEATFEAAIRMFSRHRGLLVGHHPGVCNARMLVWKADHDARAVYDWAVHTTVECSERTIGGTHYSIMRSPHVERIAADLSRLT